MLYKCKFHFHDNITGDIFGVSCSVNARSIFSAVGKAVMEHRQEDHYSVRMGASGYMIISSSSTYLIKEDNLNLCAKPVIETVEK